MDTQTFREMLNAFDFYYNMSDDHKFWLKESAKADKIHQAVKDNPELLPIFEEVRYERTGYRGSAFPGTREL